MVDSPKRPRLVGSFIRQKREGLGLSQRSLGLLFNPPVTTQFISNLERGVTPLPPNHVPTLTQALVIDEAELMGLLEREYALKLSGKLGKPGGAAASTGTGEAPVAAAPGPTSHHLPIAGGDYAFMRSLYEAYRGADKKTRQAFATVCESILSLSKPNSPLPGGGTDQDPDG
jgi:transcriptional regulator with XRE-family HTH domain